MDGGWLVERESTEVFAPTKACSAMALAEVFPVLLERNVISHREAALGAEGGPVRIPFQERNGYRQRQKGVAGAEAGRTPPIVPPSTSMSTKSWAANLVKGRPGSHRRPQ